MKTRNVFLTVAILIILLGMTGLVLGELQEAPLPPGMADMPDQEIFFPVFDNVRAEQWVTYEQTVSGRAWVLEYTLKVLEVSSSGYYVLEAATKRRDETITQKWKVNISDGKIVEYWLQPQNRKASRLPVLAGANNTELMQLFDPVIEKIPDTDERRWYNITTAAGKFECWRVTGRTKNGQSAMSNLSEDVPLFQVVNQHREGMDIQLKAYGSKLQSR